MDLKAFKIKNSLILVAFGFGILFLIYNITFSNLVHSFGGAILPIILLFPLFLCRALGAGDIKLFAVIGFFFGASFVLNVMLYSLFVAGLLSIIHVLKVNRLHKRYGVIHYSPAILISYLILVWTDFIS